MNLQVRNKRDHYISVAISCVLNGGLILAMLHFITSGPELGSELNTTLVLDPVEEQIIEEIEEEIIREEIEMEEIPDMEFNTDFSVDVETDITPDQESFDAPQDTTNVNQLTELLSDIASPVQMVGLMQGRTQLARSAMVSRYGGSRGGQGQAAVNRALQWLKNHQLPDGGWTQTGEPGRACPGHTGLALLAFLSHGETPASAEYGRTVSTAIRWIVENQNSNGVISRSSHTVYGHAMATYALAEAYSVTQNLMIREPLIRAVEVIVGGMQSNGGFDYDYKNSDRNDSSVGGWQVQALKAATIALPEEQRYQRALQLAMDGMLRNTRSMQSGVLGIGYVSPGNQVRITAAGALGMIFTGRAKERQTSELIAALNDVVPNWSEGDRAAIYLWYYTAQALFQFNPGGQRFKSFNEAMSRELIQNQNQDGSWDEPGAGGGVRGRAGTTAMGALNLMVYYRHLPTGMVENLQQQVPVAPPVSAEDDDMIRIAL